MDSSRYYIGRVSKVEDRILYKIRVTIDGIVDDAMAFPMKGEVDEPLIGDKVLLYNIDPTFGSVYLYSRIKEDEFLGFRSNGKFISITPESIEMRVYNRKDDIDGREDDTEDIACKIVMDKDGNIDILAERNLTIKARNITITGPGVLTINSNAAIPNVAGGPFCAFTVAPPMGAAGVSGNKIILNG